MTHLVMWHNHMTNSANIQSRKVNKHGGNDAVRSILHFTCAVQGRFQTFQCGRPTFRKRLV